MKLYDVIKAPIISEKVATLKEELNAYVFEVDRKATKQEIKKAIETIFAVNVTNVRTLIMRGKQKKRGLYTYKQPNYKKAIVTLKEGFSIKAFENL